MRSGFPRLASLVALAASLAACGAASAQVEGVCGSLRNGNVGPYDYRTTGKETLETVESFHFGPQVEALQRGMTGEIGGDIAYTLHVYPNHHRALMAMMRLGEKQKSPQAVGARYSVECYFERAIRFRRDDAIGRMIYATYLIKNRREPEARVQLEEARRIGKENPFTQYNVGHVYFEMKDYDRALAQAHAAERMGFEKPELKKRLQGVGKWVDPKPGLKAASLQASEALPPLSAASEASSGSAASEAAR